MSPKMKHLLFCVFILTEVIVASILGYQIYNKQKNILGVASINPIKKENFIFNSNSELKYFYEPKPNTIEGADRWAPSFVMPSIKLDQIFYTTNSDGLNERFDYPISKSDSTYRIITLGDSFTYGVFVNTKDNWTEQLEDLLNIKLSCNKIEKFETINLGVPGYDIEYSAERFKLKGIKYNPDLILWFLKKDDFIQINEIFREELTKFETSTNNKISQNEPLEFSDKIRKEWLDIIEKSTNDKLGEDNVLELQKNNLSKLNNYYTGPLLIFTFPLVVR